MSISKTFIEGLSKYNVTLPELQANYKYCGGNRGSHLKYFKLVHGYNWIGMLPAVVGECVCKHKISENCFITDGTNLIVLGNCCIHRFMPKSGRTCEICDESHKNRVCNRCNSCRKGKCDGCGKKIDSTYKKCYNCKFN
jgi:hypothetical protein